MQVAAIFVAPPGSTLPPILTSAGPVPVRLLARFGGAELHRARFALPADRAGWYNWRDQRFDVASDLRGDLRIGYASCNGEEHGDLTRDPAERGAIWARLAQMHAQQPLSLLLHGGDQIYADEATLGHPLSDGWPDHLPKDPSQADLADLQRHLREKFLERYVQAFTTPGCADLMARVPSLMQWDDHDICDGWGSLQRSRTYSPVGQTLYAVAHEAAMLFQHGCLPNDPPRDLPGGHSDDLPGRFTDPKGQHLSWQVATKDLRILGPDLRGERTRRDVMRDGGWQMMENASAATAPGRTLVMSSVPVLGPRLSLFEGVMLMIPAMQKYEDDLRDQWQSRAHRASWRRMLDLLTRMAEAPGQDLTILSGEIHLATRAEMRLRGGVMHQLVSSGVAHRPPPKAWARMLGALSHLGGSPLPGHPIRFRRIPGHRTRYVADRNALLLTRNGAGGDWSAQWLFETTGVSAPLPI